MINSIGEIYIENGTSWQDEKEFWTARSDEKKLHTLKREPFHLTKLEIMQLAKDAGGKFCQTIASYIDKCFSFADIENSISALKRNRPDLFKVKR